VFGGVYQEAVKGQPITIESIGRRGVTRLGIAPGSQRSFGEVFARSAAAAGLAEATGDGKITLFAKPLAAPSDAEGAGSPDTMRAADTDTAAVPQSPAGRAMPKPVLDQRWPLPDGEVALIVTIDRPLAAADFASIGQVVSQIEQLVAGLTRGDTDA
jgi:hypothetical protein